MKQILLFAILFLAACTTAAPAPMNDEGPMDVGTSTPAEPPAWMSVEVTDVNSGETYTLGQFNKPVFVESFAVWCPTCTRQQLELKKFHGTNKNFVSISLDTDPNEDEQAVRDHATRNEFNWRYSVSPAELTQGLIDDFGLGVVNAPAVPVVLICPDKSTKLLGRGVKDQNDLSVAIASCGVA